MAYNLRTVFDLVEWPLKKVGAPPLGSETIQAYGDKYFPYALKYFGNLRVQPETKQYVRTIYYWEGKEGAGMALVQETKSSDEQ